MASFFALAVSQFPKDDKGDIQWPLHYVSGLLFGISFAVSIPLLLFAFNVDYAGKVWNYFRFILLQRCAIIAIKQLRHVPILSVRTKGYDWLLEKRRNIRNYREEGVEKSSLSKIKAHFRVWDEWAERLMWNLERGDRPQPDLFDVLEWDELREYFI
ncbi:hypothetical protein NHQ30_006792 [Ciborinia camelliae]|nr:hypothetical protein NHQ30_006792 [Ciborinia camelliae]